MKKRLFCLLLILVLVCSMAQADSFVYGQSELGRDLLCERIGTGSVKILMIFGVHGYEDAYDRDGQMLKDIAQALAQHYAQPDTLPETITLLIVPCANPDGLEEGKSKNGFGRCNALGIDINRDFDVDWVQKKNARNRTGDTPFATAEARAIRSLVESESPDYAIDVHGWIACVYGNENIAKPFMDAFGFKLKKDKSGGKLSQWLDAHTKGGLLIELPAKPKSKNYLQKTTEKLINGLDALFDLVADTKADEAEERPGE